MAFRVAIVATACEFPESRTPGELWDTVLHARRCFRAIPTERLDLSAYAHESDPDGIYPIEAGLLEGYRFDRERYRIPLSTFERTDMAHWLALDVATRALAALGPAGIDAERDGMGVIVANTLTGEFSRSIALRYRWPYVEQVIRAAARGSLPEADLGMMVARAEAVFKTPFPVPDEDSLAGALANTIAGRIASYHGLRGGAHTVDGACASSLVAVSSAYERLAMGDVSCALVGAVDLSLDPFELVGFARNGAMSRQLMRVFDRQAGGFWPGEGCGFIVMASEAAVARNGWPVLAWLCGAAMSTDGQGAITRPTVEGQALAARRAWMRAGLNPSQADYFEAHGTGTPTGDTVELEGLAMLLDAAMPSSPVPIGSVKANIGHTKAAAGMAGLLKAISICRERIIPPTTGCVDPHPLLGGETGARVTVRSVAAPVAHPHAVTVGVSSFGFGGVNCHVVLQGEAPSSWVQAAVPVWSVHAPGGELFQLAADDADQLGGALDRLALRAGSLSRAQLADLAHAMNPGTAPAWRACVVAQTPAELRVAARAAASSVRGGGRGHRHTGRQFSWSSPAVRPARIAFLFPGQGSVPALQAFPWGLRFSCLRQSTECVTALARQDCDDTAVLQPLLAEVAIAGIGLLKHFGIDPDVVLGHSFGELPALHASGRLDADDLRALAAQRGRCMRDLAPPGAMLAVQARREIADTIAAGHHLELACENGAERYVLGGAPQSVRAAAAACRVNSVAVSILPTGFAFHTSSMEAAGKAFAPHAARVAWRPGRHRMVSSITGRMLDGEECVAELLARQITEPVRFFPALAGLGDVDLLLEIGAGSVLAGLAEEHHPGRVAGLELFGESLQGTLSALGAAWVCGAPLRRAALYEGRGLRECAVDGLPLFLSNPCGVTTQRAAPAPPVPERRPEAAAGPPAGKPVVMPDMSSLQALREVVAEQTGLSAAGLDTGLRLLSDLHLNSIRARHVVALAAQRVGIAKIPFELARIANASLAEAASYLDGLRGAKCDDGEPVPSGVASWLRFFSYEWRESALPQQVSADPPAEDLVQRITAAGTASTPSMFVNDTVKGRPHLILVLPGAAELSAAGSLLEAAGQLLPTGACHGVLVLQAGQVGNAFLQSVSAERPACRMCAVEYASLGRAAVLSALAEYGRCSAGYSELRLRNGRVERRVMREATRVACGPPGTLSPGSVLLVTGGARGIGAISARALALRYGCRLALLGRSPAGHGEVMAHMAICHDKGIGARYFQTDITDALRLRETVAMVRSEMGPVRAVLHAAGVNDPVPADRLGMSEITRTLAGKVSGLRTLLDCLPDGQPDLLIGYGSVIGELGLPGEAHYALANEWLGQLLGRIRDASPACRVLQLNWTAWRETGMARRIDGVLEGLHQGGTRPIDNDEALDALVRAIEEVPDTSVIICGRYGRQPDAADLRLLQPHRYLEQPRVFYPGVELVADAVICSDTDRYLQDHAPYGVPVFPLVCAMEAMLSAVHCLLPDTGVPVMRAMQVDGGISCPPGQRFVLRTCALVQDDGTVRVELRASTSGYEVNHFAAVFDPARPTRTVASPAVPAPQDLPAAPLLYRGLCFHGQRFQRVGEVEWMSSTGCQVRLVPGPRGDWYGSLLPGEPSCGEPAVRDAVLHALQLCIPHQVVFPVAVAEVCPGPLSTAAQYVVSAWQRFSDGTRFVFDVDVRTPDGVPVEQWRGLELMRGAAGTHERLQLAPELLGALCGRLLHDELGAQEVRAGCAVTADRASGRQFALERALEPGGSPAGRFSSVTHAEDLTVALVSAVRPVALDLQFSPGYSPDEWQLMLGPERMRFVSRIVEADLVPLQTAVLFAWTISECLVKLGMDGWPLSQAGCRRIDAAHVGPVLAFSHGQLRVLVTGLSISGHGRAAALALALREDM